MPTPIKSLSLSEIQHLCKQLGLPRFRADQLIGWLFIKQVTTYGEMTNLPKALREELSQNFPLLPAALINKQVSRDGTRKYCFEFFDGARVEAVGIPSTRLDTQGNPTALSVCFSTQAGCSMKCAFCATGEEGLTRNLSSGEMIDQVAYIQNDFGIRVSHVVSMGQGEPFLNYDATIEALDFLNSKSGFGIGARHITISTCGNITGIGRLGQDPHQYTLAISLHSAQQDVRDMLMPRCSAQPLPLLKQALLNYQKSSGRRVSLEYLMIEEVNDTEEALHALLDFAQGIFCHINLIPLNSVDHAVFEPSAPHTVSHWRKTLLSAGIETTIRDSRGADIDGACGQLKNKLA